MNLVLKFLYNLGSIEIRFKAIFVKLSQEYKNNFEYK